MLSRCRVVVLDDQHAAQALCENFASSRCSASTSSLALDRLERVADRAQLERLVRVVGDRDDVHRDVARARVALELVEHGEAGVIGQVDVEQDRARPIAARRGAALRRRCARRRTGSRARAPGRAGSRRSAGRPRRRGCRRASASAARGRRRRRRPRAAPRLGGAPAWRMRRRAAPAAARSARRASRGVGCVRLGV